MDFFVLFEIPFLSRRTRKICKRYPTCRGVFVGCCRVRSYQNGKKVLLIAVSNIPNSFTHTIKWVQTRNSISNESNNQFIEKYTIWGSA